MKIILNVLRNNKTIRKERIDLTERAIMIGRSAECDIHLDDLQISRKHFSIKIENQKAVIESTSALSNIFINGEKVQKKILSLGDMIVFPPYSMSVFFENEAKVEASTEVEGTEVFNINDLGESEATEIIDEDNSEESFNESTENIELDSPEKDEFSSNDFENDFEENGDGFDNFGDESFPVADSIGDKTGVFTDFMSFHLMLFGEKIPYDKYRLEEKEVYIGRDADKCKIVLEDEDVSSVHAVIRKEGAKCYLEDLKSTNGTLLNGERINKEILSSGDEFLIGSVSFTFEVKSKLFQDEKASLMPVEPNQEITKEEIVEEEVDYASLEAAAEIDNSLVGKFKRLSMVGKVAVVGIIAYGVIWFLEPPKKKKIVNPKNNPAKVVDENVLSKEKREEIENYYQLGTLSYTQRDYENAIREFEKVVRIKNDYKEVQTYLKTSKDYLAKIEELEKRRREEEERLERAAKVEQIIVRARKAVDEEKIELANNYFNQILEIDPTNTEVQQLRFDLEAQIKEREKKEQEKIDKINRRRNREGQLEPARQLHAKREWFNAITKLQKFLQIREMDLDLIKEARQMLEESQDNLSRQIRPMLRNARSYKAQQDLKRAHERYTEIRKIDPNNSEALDEIDNIFNQLRDSSRKLYREALIAESLSLFDEAREKFQQVQQISPVGSEYYEKASIRLREYN